MTKPISFGKIDVELVSSMDRSSGLTVEDTPFRILVMGDFSGRASRGIFAPGKALSARPRLVDRDNLEGVMERLGVALNIPFGGEESRPVVIGFSELDDFHPDRLFERLDIFKQIRERREEIRSRPGTVGKKEAGRGTKPSDDDREIPLAGLTGETTGDLLDSIIDEAGGAASGYSSKSEPSGWDDFLKQITEPHLCAKEDDSQSDLLSAVDDTVGEMMRALLHFPPFQELESIWRGMHFLLSRIDDDTEVRVFLLDVSKEELAADLDSSEDLGATGFYRLLFHEDEDLQDEGPWSLLIGNYTFGNSREEMEMLGRMARLAGACGAPFVAAADREITGVVKSHGLELCEEWDMLRRLPESSFIGLAFPRFLLRLPYGEDSDPTELFPFEEMGERTEIGGYLWGNPSLFCAALLARSFCENGPKMAPGLNSEIEDLPLHIYWEDGESKARCIEVRLSEAAAEAVMENGLIPIIQFMNRDIAKVARFQSMADPPAPLAGRWDIGGH